MAEQNKILIVDDNFEVALFLRTTLEIMLPEYHVVNVPSAEEGLLEVRRSDVDLIVTDLNLPGLPGLDFIDRLRRRSAKTPIIVITGEKSEVLHQQAQRLNPAGFFVKPINVDEFASAVRRILKGEPAVVTQPSAVAPREIPPQVGRRLSALRIDTGAQYALLIDRQGSCLVKDGQVSELPIDRVAPVLTQVLQSASELARLLKAPQPFTINYQAGAVHDLYTASIGGDYLVALIFDSKRGRSQLGAVWVYARRAVKDLYQLLRTVPAAPPPSPKARPEPVAEPVTQPVAEPVAQPAAAPAKEKEPEPVAPPAEPEPEAPPAEVEAFWESVFSQEELGENGGFSGISLEEAQAKGLLPSGFDLSS